MDEFLANLYGTNGYGDETDVEKLAQAEMLTKIAEENGIDIDELGDEQVAMLADQAGLDFGEGEVELFQGEDGGIYDENGWPYGEGEDGNLYPYPEEMVDGGITSEASARFEEADFLGRVMAHSFNDEFSKIASRSGGTQLTEAEAKKFTQQAKQQQALSRGMGVGPVKSKKAKGIRAAAPFGAGRGGRVIGRLAQLGQKVSFGKIKSGRAAALTGLGTALAATGAAGYGGYKGVKALQKRSSVQDGLLESMAQDRAVNFLSQFDLSDYGYDFDPVEGSRWPARWSTSTSTRSRPR